MYGSRFIGSDEKRVCIFGTAWKFYTSLLSNMFSNLNLTDMENCYKVFKSDIIKNIKLKENRFGFEPEITAKISKIKNLKIYEVGLNTTEENTKMEKITWKDGFSALRCIFYYNFFD